MKQDQIQIKPLLTTWGYKKDSGDWDMSFPSEFLCSTIKQQKESYIKVIKITLDVFDDFARVYKISISSFPETKSKLGCIFIEWQQEEDYEKYLERILDTINNHPDEIYTIELYVELNVFVYTKESPEKPIRTWVRYFDESLEMGKFSIDISTREDEPSMRFFLEHTLFYPFSYQNNEDNTELFELNRAFLEKAFRCWEKKFDSEIEAGGLPGIYKYGFLPYKEWNQQ